MQSPWAAYLQGLTGEEATKQPPMIRKADGVFTEYWCEGGRVRCRWSKTGANVLLAVECRIDDNRQTDFLDWRTYCGVAGRPPKMGCTHGGRAECVQAALRSDRARYEASMIVAISPRRRRAPRTRGRSAAGARNDAPPGPAGSQTSRGRTAPGVPTLRRYSRGWPHGTLKAFHSGHGVNPGSIVSAGTTTGSSLCRPVDPAPFIRPQ